MSKELDYQKIIPIAVGGLVITVVGAALATRTSNVSMKAKDASTQTSVS